MLALTTLGSEHRAAMSGHLLALDGPDRCDRFLVAVQEDFVQRYVQNIPFERDILIGVLEGPMLVGLVHAGLSVGRPVAPAPNEANPWSGPPLPSAELGVSVLSSHRRQGLGRRLLKAAIEAARARGLARVEVLFRSSNQGMTALTRNMGGHIEHWGAECHSVFEL
jgi:GNAT superfamily N-acetyltransferase